MAFIAICYYSSTAHGDTHDTVIANHENDIEQIILLKQDLFGSGNSEVRTHYLSILTRPLYHPSYRASVYTNS